MISVDAALDRIGFGRFQLITLILSGIGFGAATVELVAISQIKIALQQKWQLETSALGMMGTSTFLGEIVGGIVWAYLSDRHGREKVFLATSASMLCFSLLLPFCETFTQFCWIRLFLGFAIGGGLSVDFVYFIECVPPRNRSFRSAFIILIGILGLIYSAGSGIILLEKFGYKIFLLACSLPSAALLLGRLFWRIESPKYLAARGKFKEADLVLMEIARINGVTGHHFELNSDNKNLNIKSKVLDEKTNVFKGHRSLITLASITFFCQTSAYYGLTLWMSQFLSPWGLSPSLMLMLIGLAEIPGLAMTTLMLKYFEGTRVILGLNFGAASVISLAIFWVTDQKSFIFAFCGLYFFIVSIWTILYVHIPEGFPTLYRSRCFAIAGTFGKIGGMLSPIFFGWLFGRKDVHRITIHLLISCLFLIGALASFKFRNK